MVWLNSRLNKYNTETCFIFLIKIWKLQQILLNLIYIAHKEIFFVNKIHGPSKLKKKTSLVQLLAIIWNIQWLAYL